MKKTFHAIAAIVFTCAVTPIPLRALQPATLEQARTTFDREWEANIQKTTEELNRLSLQYESALGRLLEARRQAGELDGVLATQREVERFATSKTVEDEHLTPHFPELRKLQETYRLTSTRIRGESAGLRLRMANQLEATLERMQTQLTRENAIEEALLVRNYRTNLASDPQITQAQAAWQAWQTLSASLTPPPATATATPPAPAPATVSTTPAAIREPLGNEIAAIKRRYKQFYKALVEKNTQEALSFVDPEQIRVEGLALMNVRLNVLTSWIAAVDAAGGKPDTDKVVINQDRTTAVAVHTIESNRLRLERTEEMQWVKRNDEWYILLKERRAGEAGPPRRPPSPPRVP